MEVNGSHLPYTYVLEFQNCSQQSHLTNWVQFGLTNDCELNATIWNNGACVCGSRGRKMWINYLCNSKKIFVCLQNVAKMMPMDKWKFSIEIISLFWNSNELVDGLCWHIYICFYWIYLIKEWIWINFWFDLF